MQNKKKQCKHFVQSSILIGIFFKDELFEWDRF